MFGLNTDGKTWRAKNEDKAGLGTIFGARASKRRASYVRWTGATTLRAVLVKLGEFGRPATQPGAQPIFSVYLAEFAESTPLRERVQKVLLALPEQVQHDFLSDPRFRVTLCNYVSGKGWTLLMDSPGSQSSGSRCVVLRPKLAVCSEAFACYVIAHEFAHAFLRNGPWGEISDVEEAADALAASWGFVRSRE